MRKLCALGTSLGLILATGAAHADWPSARHDPQRTGVAQSTSDITHPAVYWKAYVGGSISPTGFLAGDVDHDGTPELLYVSGGSVVAKHPNGQTLWQTGPHDIQSIVAIDDFDGDGLVDVLAAGTSRAFLLAGKDGAFEWSEPSSDFGALGSLRVADLNGDGRPDVLAEECHCCAVTVGASGYAYSFKRTGANTSATKLWALPAATGDFYSCGASTVVFDGDGDGHVELAYAGITRLYVVGSNGQLLVDADHTPAIGQMLYLDDCLPANVDGVPGDELVCFQRVVEAIQPTPRQVFVLHYNTTASPAALELLWQNTAVADEIGGDLDFEPGAVVDLDGNGTKEVIASGMTSAGVWTTYVFDGKTGSTLATIPGARTAGTAPLRSGGKIDVLTSDGRNLTAWTYDASLPTPLTLAWTEPDRRTVTRVDPALLRTMRANQALVTPDLNHDGVDDLLTLTVSPGSVLYGYAAPAGAATQIAAFTFPKNVDPIGTWTVPPTTRAYPQVAMVANDGLLRVFSDQLQADSAIRSGGFCAGGLTNSPVVASFGGVGGTQSVFVSDSRNALQRFDAQTSSLANPPKAQWSLRNCAGPSVFPSLDGARPGIVCRGAQQPVSYPALPSVSAVRGDGSLIWNAPVADPQVYNDALPGSADVSGAPTVFFQTVDREANVTTRALSGSTGLPMWSASPIAVQWGVHPFSVADWNGDGVADVISVDNTMAAISGVNGSTVVQGTDFLAYGVPILQDLDNDGVLEATLQGGYYPARTFQHDLATTTWVGDDTEPYPTGGIASCAAGLQLVEGSYVYPSRVYMTPVTGSSVGTSSHLVLAGGKAYPDEAAAQAAGAYLGQLSDLAIATNLTGTDHPTAVVGDTGGWVYALDACNGKIQFTLNMNESVCGAIFGDTNADGKDEILVSTSGGYVYDIQNEEVGGCGPVLDVDPPHGITDKQVDHIQTEATLFGAWQPVQGAAGYEVAVSHDPDGIISDPPWQDVGTATSATVTGLPLVAGETYHFVVRAVGAQGMSVDALSAGVTVSGGSAAPGTDGGIPGEDAGGGTGNSADPGAAGSQASGCGCRTCATGTNDLPLFLGTALAAGLVVRRRFGKRR